ncbi:MAG: signal peptide peptidase SppA [Deltaproteobacteria bacterium]|nr:signal peptide peptidase SppA [Deltaproteobacteria bacterium]
MSARPVDVLRRLGANLTGGVRRGVAGAMLSRARPVWVRIRLAPPLAEMRAPSLPLVAGSGPPHPSLLEVLATLDAASRDPDVTGILLRLDGAPGGMARALAVRRAVAEARERKPVLAFGESLSATDYLIGSAASEVWAPPAGGISLVGLRMDSFFLRDALEKVGVKMDVLRVGSHKTAAEMFTRTGMSPEQREQMEALLDAWYGALVDGIAAGRGRAPDEVRAWIDRGPHRARTATDEGWLDACRYPDEAQDEVVARTPGAEKIEDLRVLDGSAYYGLRGGEPGWRPLLSDLPRIAYVVASGGIRRGRGFRGVASEPFRRIFEQLRRDDGVRGVVLRIDSPGGDALASDLLWRSIMLVREKKPVVVSMGDVAASGGYYMAAAGDAVLAEAGTITGSIGVVGGKLDVSGLYERLGIGRESVERGARAGLESETRSFTPDEREALRSDMRGLYDLFLERVAEGRGLPADAVARCAQGRVWSGDAARGHGLVDALGGPLEALVEVRRRAGLTEGERIVLELHPRMPRFEGLRSLVGLSSGGLRPGGWL